MNAGTPHARLLVEERRRLIAEQVQREGRVTVAELSEHFETSAVTIRGDLGALADAGRLVRSHGGAVSIDVNPVDIPLPVKEVRHLAQKRRIAAAAARLIRDGETIILDSGSTTAEVARVIFQRPWQSLTVITNALNIAFELCGASGVRVMMLGGLLRPASYSLVGPGAEEVLSGLTADRVFLGVDGLDASVGVTTPDPQEAALNAMMVRVSREVVAVLDSSKFGRRSLSLIARTRDLDVVITDVSAPDDAVRALTGSGVRVQLE